MRAQKLILRALAVSTAIAAQSLPMERASAEDLLAVRATAFRILFPDGSAIPSSSGGAGEQNRSSIVTMARILAYWSAQGNLRFLFVAPRPVACAAAQGCNPDQLHWQRVNAATALIKEHLGRGQIKLRFGLIGLAFLDELAPGASAPELPPAPPGLAAIDLRTYLDDRRRPASGDCPWQLLLFDPGLPPVIGARDGVPAIPLAPGEAVPTGDGALVQVESSRGARGEAMALWEPRQGEFCRAPAGLLAGEAARVPNVPVRLHLLLAEPGDAELRRLSAALAEGCRADLSRPSIMRGVTTADTTADTVSRGMGDHVGPLPADPLRVPRPERAQTVHCEFAFAPTAPASSR